MSDTQTTTPPQDDSNVINLADYIKYRKLDSPNIIPEFITPASIAEMTEDEQNEVLNLIKLRRVGTALLAATTKSATQRGEVSRESLAKQIDKLCERIFKKIEKVKKEDDMLEEMFHKLRGLRLQAAMDPDG